MNILVRDLRFQPIENVNHAQAPNHTGNQVNH